jgi:hypothetical protein
MSVDFDKETNILVVVLILKENWIVDVLNNTDPKW